MPSLVVANLDAKQQAFLESWGVQDFPVREEKDELRYLPPEKLKALFRHESSGRVHLQKLLYNLIWQAYTMIKSGKRKSVDGNLRSFWYTDVKTPLSELGLPGDRAPFKQYAARCSLGARSYTDFACFQ